MKRTKPLGEFAMLKLSPHSPGWKIFPLSWRGCAVEWYRGVSPAKIGHLTMGHRYLHFVPE